MGVVIGREYGSRGNSGIGKGAVRMRGFGVPFLCEKRRLRAGIEECERARYEGSLAGDSFCVQGPQ